MAPGIPQLLYVLMQRTMLMTLGCQLIKGLLLLQTKTHIDKLL
jgi:hypothetical protein